MSLVVTSFSQSFLSPPEGAMGMCLVHVLEYILDFGKHVTVGFCVCVSVVSVVSTFCCALKFLFLAVFLQQYALEIRPAGCRRVCRRFSASDGCAGFQILRPGPAPLGLSPPHTGLQRTSVHASLPRGKEAVAESQTTQRRVKRAAGLSPPERLPVSPCVRVPFPPISANVRITQRTLRNWRLIITPHVTGGIEYLSAHSLASQIFDPLNCSLFSAAGPSL